jgi:hypothetical protein
VEHVTPHSEASRLQVQSVALPLFRVTELVTALQLGMEHRSRVIGVEVAKVLFPAKVLLRRMHKSGIAVTKLLVHHSHLAVLPSQVPQGALQVPLVVTRAANHQKRLLQS